MVDATITQGSVTHTWAGFKFGEYSDWVSIFRGGSGTIVIKDHASGQKLLTTTIPLTPGPLVVVIKDSWPPKEAKNVETIAASFVPPKTGSKVRLFNLANDVQFAGLWDSGGQQLADEVQYSLGSAWAAVPSAKQLFSAVSDTSNGTNGSMPLAAPLATVSFAPPAAPQVFTTFLMGSASFGYVLLPLGDAPETGPCKPP